MSGGAQDRAAADHQFVEHIAFEKPGLLGRQQPFIDVDDSNGLPTAAVRRLGDGPDDGIEPGTISAARDDTYARNHGPPLCP